ncbi:hypothetical protein GRX03_11390 [Halovenus sp. WSH3]|uniref:Solute-binding protein family 5 domain-containing protein n=1 Tax=Halovenus carboxidivorans TaxID=2692199 RepID=A0A6B0TA12_9EURY|nr:ABC transporter substrate-binding protein [Halovenus carboxidivorans]MXR52202.1 hypothetical protein [Halovenus carboxidivorans]
MSSDGDQSHVESTRRKVLAAMGGGVSVGLAGCGIFDSESSPSELTVSAGANISTFDPTIIADATSASTVGAFCYEYLVDNNFSLTEWQPSLATSWTQVDDTTFEMQLREGVQFHNGDEMTAEDVRFSVERIRGTVNTAAVDNVDNVEILGDYQIRVNLTNPRGEGLFLTNFGGVPILPSSVDGLSTTPSEDSFSFQDQSLGTGPFELDAFQSEDRLEIVPFDDYWYDGDDYPSTPPWERVTFRIIPEQSSQEEAMQNGELDMIDNPAPFNLGQWDSIDPEPKIGDAVGFDFVSYPVNQSPYNNPKLRRGMTKLIPRSDVIQAVFSDFATPLGGPISPGLGTYFDEERNQELLDNYVGENREEALSLIEEAFNEEGIEPPFDLSFITNVNTTRERWMEVIQQTFDETELFNAELEVQAFDQLVPFLVQGEAAESTDIVGIGWTGGSDPNGHVEQLLASDQHVPAGFNWNLYENEEVDRLITEGKQATETEERIQIYRELETVLANEVPEAFMWTGDAIQVIQPDSFANPDDWQPYPNASFRYWSIYRPNVGKVVEPPE